MTTEKTQEEAAKLRQEKLKALEATREASCAWVPRPRRWRASPLVP